MRNYVLSAVGMAVMALYNFCAMPDQELAPAPVPHYTAQQRLPQFDIGSTTQEVNTIQAEVKEIAPQLGATANDQLMQSIATLSRQVGQIHGSLVTEDKVEEIVASRTGRFVTANAMSDAIDEVKNQLKTAASACDCKCEEQIAAILKRLDALEAKCSAPVKTGSANSKVAGYSQTDPATGVTTYYEAYGSYGSATVAPKASSGGCTGSRAVQYSQPVVTSVSETVVCQPTVTSSYAVSSQPVVVSSGGCTGSVSYSQPVYQQAVQSVPVQSAVVAMPQETREVRVVEPRQPRRVSTAEIPTTSYPAVGFTDQSTCDMNDPNSPCARAAQAQAVQAVQAQPRPKLGSRIFGR